MSKGPGKTQQAILKVLEKKKGWVYLSTLIVCALHPERFDEFGDCIDERWTWVFNHSEHVSTHRAIKGLEKRGLVETQLKPAGYMERPTRKERGGVSRYKLIRLKR